MKHTPGPWTYRTGFDRGEPTSLEIQAGATLVASILNPDHEANARLIAAAPELLEACKFALKLPEYNLGVGTVEVLKAAIAKAEGR